MTEQEQLQFFLYTLFHRVEVSRLEGSSFVLSDSSKLSYHLPARELFAPGVIDDENGFRPYFDFIKSLNEKKDLRFNASLRDVQAVMQYAADRDKSIEEEKLESLVMPARGKRDHVSIVSSFVTEFDVGQEGHKKDSKLLPTSKEQIDEILREAGVPKPTCIVKSGHGYHYFWILRDPFYLIVNGVREATYVPAKHAYRAFQQRIISQAAKMGLHVDSTAGIEREWRLPGTWNRKIVDSPKPVTLLDDVDFDACYDLNLLTPPAGKRRTRKQMQRVRELSSDASTPVEKTRLWICKQPPADPLYAAFQATIDGNPIAEPGERDNTLQSLISTIIFACPDAREIDPKDFVEQILGDSLSHWDDEDWVENAISKTERALDEFEEKQKERDENEQAELKQWHQKIIEKRIELQPEAPLHKVPLIVRYKDNWYVYNMSTGDYFGRELIKSEVIHTARKLWDDPERLIVNYNAKGEPKDLTPEKLVEKPEIGGVEALGIRPSVIAQVSYYNPEDRLFYVAYTPMRRDVQPVFHEGIDALIDEMFGDNAEFVKDWMAAAPRLKEPCTALYIEGLPNTGKTFLAYGIASLWNTSPTPFEQFFGGMRSKFSMLDNPILHIDEGVTDVVGITNNVRKMLTNSIHYIERKGVDPMQLHGYLRLIITANNPNALNEPNVRHTHSDGKAIQERIAYVYVRPEVVDFFAAVREILLEEQPHTNGDLVEAWVKPGHFANYVEWLNQNRSPKRNRLYCTQEELTPWHFYYLLSTNSVGSYVFEWVARYATHPIAVRRNLGRDDTPLESRIHRGEIILRSQEVLDNWTTYIKSKGIKTPSIKDVNVALETMCERRGYYHVVKTDFLKMFVEHNQVGSWSVIEENLRNSHVIQ